MTYTEIKEKRKKYNISQTKIAEVSGFSKALISSWELEKKIPTNDELRKTNIALSQIINDINNSVFDIRKKRIISSVRKKGTLPDVISTAQEYNNLLASRILKTNNPYKNTLTNLYEKAMAPRKHTAPKAIALFSGCGGLSLGFASEGFNLVGHVEIDDSANIIYKNNFPESSLLGKNICDISDSDINSWKKNWKEIDIIIGGPPCQGFSLAGKRNPADLRNQLYKYYVHMVSILKPKIFLMENVRLLTSMKNPNGQLFIDCITSAFSEIGYSISRHEINACNYGVPQSRERIILVGIRKDINKTFEFPVGKYQETNQENIFFKSKKILTFRDATSDLDELESGERSSDPLHWSIVHPRHVIEWLKDVPEGCSAHDNKNPSLRPPSGFNTTYKRIHWDQPCSTISTNFSMISGCRNVHPCSTRSLTIREAARAQSFPDEFIFTGKWGDIRKVIGNAVPPILAANIAHELLIQFFS